MRRPLVRGTPIDMNRVRNWLSEFSAYRIPVTEGRLDRWLGQFAPEHRDLAGRVLDAVDFVGSEQMAAAFREALASLPGWHREESQRAGNWYFAAFSGGAGESGDQMLHRFRVVNNLAGRPHAGLFKYRSELLAAAPGPEDTVVLIDDFAGTGEQACEAWSSFFHELVPFGAKIYLLLVAASVRARDRIAEKTDMIPFPAVELGHADDIFSPKCKFFTANEKAILMDYCSMASSANPRGRGDCGFVFVMAHSCPNNSIPILHVRRQEWEGLFRRYD